MECSQINAVLVKSGFQKTRQLLKMHQPRLQHLSYKLLQKSLRFTYIFHFTCLTQVYSNMSILPAELILNSTQVHQYLFCISYRPITFNTLKTLLMDKHVFNSQTVNATLLLRPLKVCTAIRSLLFDLKIHFGVVQKQNHINCIIAMMHVELIVLLKR